MDERLKGKTEENNDNAISPMLTVAEACRLLNVHGNTLRRWSNQGIIKAYRLGFRGERRFKREEIEALLIEQETRRGQTNVSSDRRQAYRAR